MKDQSKTKHVLIQELASLRQRISEFKRLESERKRTEDVLRQSNAHYRALADNSLLGVAVMNLDYRIISVNATFAALFRKPADDFVGKYCFNEFEKRPAVCSHCPGRRAMASGKAAEVETKGKRDDGSFFYVKNRAFPFLGPDGTVNGFIETVEDIDKQKRAELELRESEEKYRRFFSTSRDCVFLTSRDGNWIDLNEAAVELFGYASREELMQVKIPDLYVNREDRIKHTSIIAERGYTKELPVDLRRKDGTVVHTLITSVSLHDKEGNVTGYQGTIRDITYRKLAEEELKNSEKRYHELSIIDDLTQLYNSRHFYIQLKSETERSNRYGQPLTLLLLDLDDFKRFNDAYGHIEGDRVLSRFGQVFKRCLRQTDSAYRYGGEEFTILLPMTTRGDGVVIAERIRAEFKKEIFPPVAGKDLHMTVSIGLAQYKSQEDIKAFVHRVDQLMYQAKKNGKDRVYSES